MIPKNRVIHRYIATIVLLLSVAGCDDTEIQVSYDETANFSSIATYSWAGTKDPEIDAVTHARILQSLARHLDSKGLRNVDLQPDVYVTYFANARDDVVVNMRHVGYSTGPGWSWFESRALLYGSSPEIRTYTTGSLIVDIHSAGKRRLIWRGVLSGSLSSNPKTNQKLLSGGLKKLFKHFPPPEQGSQTTR